METQAEQKKDRFAKVCEILERNEYKPAKLIPILQQVQEKLGYLAEDVLTFIATSLNIPPAQAYGVATFYAHFTLEPKGKYVIKVCNGTACNVRGSMGLLEVLQDKLGVTDDEPTTEDQIFTVEQVSCLGACGLAPVVMINEDIHGQVTPERMAELIDEIARKENE